MQHRFVEMDMTVLIWGRYGCWTCNRPKSTTSAQLYMQISSEHLNILTHKYTC